MATELGRKLAVFVVADLHRRMGRSEGESLGQMIGAMTMDSGLLFLQEEWAAEFDKVIQADLDAAPMEPVAPVSRIAERQAPSPCGGRGGRCKTHGRPMGADLQCDEGRGGPLQLPKPTAQRPRIAKKRPAAKVAKKRRQR